MLNNDFQQKNIHIAFRQIDNNDLPKHELTELFHEKQKEEEVEEAQEEYYYDE